MFPRRTVRLCHEGGHPFVADPGLVTFYNRGQRYWRSALAPADECEWFAVDRRLLLDAVRSFDPTVDERPERPFKFAHELCRAFRAATGSPLHAYRNPAPAPVAGAHD